MKNPSDEPKKHQEIKVLNQKNLIYQLNYLRKQKIILKHQITMDKHNESKRTN